MPLCLTVSNGTLRSARRKQRRDSAIYTQIHEYPLTDYCEGEAAITMLMMRRHSPRDPHYGTGQSMERILKRYQACNSIHITSHLFRDPRSCAASRKVPTTSSSQPPMTLRRTSRKR